VYPCVCVSPAEEPVLNCGEAGSYAFTTFRNRSSKISVNTRKNDIRIIGTTALESLVKFG